MKITDTPTYLHLAMATLETKIAPELSGAEAQASAEMLKQLLGELLRREQSSSSMLTEQLRGGEALMARMRAFCVEAGIDPHAALPAIGKSHDFAALRADHDVMGQHIARLSASLADGRHQITDAEQGNRVSALLHEAALWDQAFPTQQRECPVEATPPLAKRAGGPMTQELLQAFLQSRHPDGQACSVEAFKPVPGGFGKQTFRATLRDASGTLTPIIVRKSDPTPMVKKGCFLIDEEFYLLKDIHANGPLPVAEPLWLGKDVPGVDADFYVMSALNGAIPSSFLGAGSAAIPESIVLQLAEQMARLHQMPLTALTDYLKSYEHPDVATDTVESSYRRAIAEWKAYYEAGDHLPSAFVSYLLDWLDQNLAPDARRPVLVHGDFNIHNILAVDGQITGVLDWECAMIGAPEQDLAYVRAIISQHMDWDRFLSHYKASGGPDIDPGKLDYYMAFSAMRLCVVFNKGTRNMQDGVTRDIRYSVVDLSLTPEFMKQALACTKKMA
jgi:aminoglycoside phosphotransferase (APT) family kinase protein